jgi:hypothetical protein
MSTQVFEGALEVDRARGVIYFHTNDEDVANLHGSVSILRICGLPKNLPERAIDLTLRADSPGQGCWLMSMAQV